MKISGANIGREQATGELPKEAQCLWFTANGQVEWRTEKLPDLQPGEALVQMCASGISRGTERLVLEGRVPESEYGRMRAPFQRGEFPFPVQYGYCAVGRVLAGPSALVGKSVFALHPHQDFFIVPAHALTVLPESLPARRAVLSANMETALNGVWDSQAQAGDTIAVIGAGAVGCLIAALCARLPGSKVLLADVKPERGPLAAALGAQFVDARDPGQTLENCDLVFHTSASAQGLALALSSAGLEARVIEMSWYGTSEVAVALGGAFHSQRLQILASQVGTIAPSHRARWSYARRLAKAVELLADPVFDQMITHEFDYRDSALEFVRALSGDAPGIVSVLNYPTVK
ncbi:MAG: zinc-binding alcohol dehydrogenase [Hyphomicrobiales bacterium]|nr:zinc-binding alcohol dehydrogenase [Hyphomicrobiales bacterium]MDE2115203.1 zinc-binding alcohol dehydrogenase [Hyphomicrobiales bacterium]